MEIKVVQSLVKYDANVRKVKVFFSRSGRFLEVACVLECKPVQSETCKQWCCRGEATQ